MDLHTEMYEPYLMKVAEPVQGHMERVHAGSADKIIEGIKINNPLHKCGEIMSTTPIKVNDVLLKHIY